MQTERVHIESLSLDPSNARQHPNKNLDAIKASLRKFGQQKPIVVGSNNIILAGNGTLQAAKEIGWEKIDIVRSPLKGSEATAYGIADNQTTLSSEWDDNILGSHLDALEKDGWDLADLGFDDEDMENFKVPDFQPTGIEDQGKLDELKLVTCPECGHEFSPKT